MIRAVDVGLRYLELVLRFEQLAPALVESYHGPRELALRVAAEPPRAPARLAGEAQELLDGVADGDLESDRAAWLVGHITALQTACLHLAGERLSYRDLTRRVHGVSPTIANESQFEQAHRLLDEALPGRGDLRGRFQRWLQTQLIPGELLGPGLRALAAELREHTKRRFGLPAGEAVEFDVVSGERFAGNAGYCGGLNTRVKINPDLPIGAYRLLELVSHEAYPGHHTEAVWKDRELIQRRGRVELAVWAYPTPDALIAEGIALNGLDLLLGDDAHQIAADALAPLGIPYDTATSAAVKTADELLLPVRTNIAMMIDEGSLDRTSATSYARRWLLRSDEQIERTVNDLFERRESHWAPYESCYPEGLRLCRSFVANDPDRYCRLLREQLLPSDLLTATASEDPGA